MTIMFVIKFKYVRIHSFTRVYAAELKSFRSPKCGRNWVMLWKVFFFSPKLIIDAKRKSFSWKEEENKSFEKKTNVGIGRDHIRLCLIGG